MSASAASRRPTITMAKMADSRVETILAGNMGIYQATIRWRRSTEETFTDGRYSRAHEWLFDGSASVRASASPLTVPLPFSDPSGVDPEEALVAALSSCHMLFFLSFAAKEGFVVASYLDCAVGILDKTPEGKEWMAKVTLRPCVVFEGERRPTAGEVESLYRRSHDACYVANSVRSEIQVDGKAEGIQ